MIKKIIKDNRGFTIVEVIVSIVVFSVIVIAVGAIFVQALKIERRSFAAQKIQENTLRSFEIIGREMRVSRLDPMDYSCDAPASSLSFARPGVGTIEYTLNDGQVYRKEGASDAEPITSSEVRFTKLAFCVTGSYDDDNMPSRITILAQVENAVGAERNIFNIQTSVTSRDITNDLQN